MTEAKGLVVYNTRTKTKERFVPLKETEVTIYSCGPTVYNSPHIGNMRAYIVADTLQRTIKHMGYNTKHVINITDVGHLTSDANEGEDKVEHQAKKEGVSAQSIVQTYTNEFFQYLDWIHIPRDQYIFPKATEYIQEQIRHIQAIEKKGLTYQTDDGIYFDTSLFEGYGVLGGVHTENTHQRIQENTEKRNLADFALWKFSKPEQKRQQEWKSPWGVGFPGWHIECSAMAKHVLGEQIDIHTGGIDHIPIHHNNEIAQSESVHEKPLANYWLHTAFLNLSGEKISKSKGNVYTLSELKNKGYHPLSFRYFCLLTHYRTPLAFSFEALDAASNALEHIYKIATLYDTRTQKKEYAVHAETITACEKAMLDDMNTPQALGILWKMLKDTTIKLHIKQNTLCQINTLLGLGLIPPKKPVKKILEKVQMRNKKREECAWDEADTLREDIQKEGVYLEDTEETTYLYTQPNDSSNTPTTKN